MNLIRIYVESCSSYQCLLEIELNCDSSVCLNDIIFVSVDKRTKNLIQTLKKTIDFEKKNLINLFNNLISDKNLI